MDSEKIRKKGGGGKSVLEKQFEISNVFKQVIHEKTAGSSTGETVRRTNLTCPQLADFPAWKGYKVSVPVVSMLLIKHIGTMQLDSEPANKADLKYNTFL